MVQQRFETLPENFRETTGLDSLVEVKLTGNGLRTTQDELVDLSFVGVKHVTVSYSTRERFSFEFTGRTERYEQHKAFLRKIPETATHYLLDDTGVTEVIADRIVVEN